MAIFPAANAGTAQLRSSAAVSITLIISLSACGKKSEDISDYGNQNKATNSDAADDVSGYGSLRDKLGTDTINWQETVSAGGIDYKFNIVYFQFL